MIFWPQVDVFPASPPVNDERAKRPALRLIRGGKMSADDVRFEFHLTPRGWVEGASASYGPIENGEASRPDDAVETWEEHQTQSSMFSTTYCSKRLVWAHPAHSQADRDAMRAQFKEPFTETYPGPLEGMLRNRRAKAEAPQPIHPKTPSLFE